RPRGAGHPLRPAGSDPGPACPRSPGSPIIRAGSEPPTMPVSRLLPPLLAALAAASCREGRTPDPVILELDQQVVRRSDFDRHLAGEMAVPETVTLRQILVPTLNEAREVRRRLGRTPKDFESIARQASKAPEAANGGLMGTFARGQLPAELEAAAFALPAGGTSDIVETSLGYHV